MDLSRCRSDFPILSRTAHGHPLVYLDSAATSQKPLSVLAAEDEFYRVRNANVHRGAYELSEEATAAYEAARARVARFLHADDPEEVVFVRGTTEAINLVAHGLGRGYLHKGDRIVTTVMEHHSNIVPWHLLRGEVGCEVEFVDIDDDGRLRMDDLEAKLAKPTKVVAVTHVSNVLGTVNPVRAIADRAHSAGALVVVDAAQSVPHRRVDVRELGADFLAFSGHKALGPTGIGVLWGRKELLQKLPPYMGGGEMIREVHTDRVTYRDPPARFEAGTPNVAGAVALGAALDYLEGVGWENLAAHEQALATRAVRAAHDRFGSQVRFYGPPLGRDREAVLSFSLQGVHPHDVASILDAEGVAIRSGHHCAQPLMERLGVPALSRASPYLYNTPEEMDVFVGALGKVLDVFAPRP
ncbi:MAG TPA: SufS family cysteine desulfurase [Thermoplasmata archaeon]|nr:SufS family cysteine desulfurase [Thermoplasmata archaeon]